MSEAPRHGTWVVLLSLLAGLMLTIWPLPDAAEPFRPEWTALVLVYWIMALPTRFNVGVAWLTGLVVDALTGSLLGQHAMSFTVLAFLTSMVYLRVRVYPVWQQAFAVMFLLAVHELLLILIDGSTGNLEGLSWRWAPVVTGTLLWPWVMLLLRYLRRQFQVS